MQNPNPPRPYDLEWDSSLGQTALSGERLSCEQLAGHTPERPREFEPPWWVTSHSIHYRRLPGWKCRVSFPLACNLHDNSKRQVLFSPFLRWVNWSSESLSDLHGVSVAGGNLNRSVNSCPPGAQSQVQSNDSVLFCAQSFTDWLPLKN